MKSIYLSLLVTLALMISCSESQKKSNENNIDGLWKVTKVNMGDQEMTPIARWMKFNADSTQTSGNGWLQHSVGTWSFNSDKNLLQVENTNGVQDEFNDPFKVNFSHDNMIWQRKEGEFDVTVTLEKIDNLPTSPANELYGLWKFETITEEGKEVSETLNSNQKAMLFLRWDNTYVLYNYPEGEKYGMFKTHGHRTQIDMVSYSKVPEFKFYSFQLRNDQLELTSTNSNAKITLSRIHQFIQ